MASKLELDGKELELIVPNPMEAIGMLYAARKYVLREMMPGNWEAWDTLFTAAWEIWQEHQGKAY